MVGNPGISASAGEARLRYVGEGVRKSAQVSEDVSGVTVADDSLTESPDALGFPDWLVEFAAARGIGHVALAADPAKSVETIACLLSPQSARRKFSMCCLSSSLNRLNSPTT